MPSSKRNRGKRSTAAYDNKKRLWRKMKKNKKVIIQSDELKKHWKSHKTVARNLKEMGLALNPNNVVTKPTSFFRPKPTVIEEPKQIRRPEAISDLEAMVEAHKQAKPEVNFPSYDRFFCQYMIDTYGSNYKQMVKDRKNVFQLTPSQMLKKIRQYKRTKAYQEVKVQESIKKQIEINEEMDTTEDNSTTHTFSNDCINQQVDS